MPFLTLLVRSSQACSTESSFTPNYNLYSSKIGNLWAGLSDVATSIAVLNPVGGFRSSGEAWNGGWGGRSVLRAERGGPRARRARGARLAGLAQRS